MKVCPCVIWGVPGCFLKDTGVEGEGTIGDSTMQESFRLFWRIQNLEVRQTYRTLTGKIPIRKLINRGRARIFHPSQ